MEGPATDVTSGPQPLSPRPWDQPGREGRKIVRVRLQGEPDGNSALCTRGGWCTCELTLSVSAAQDGASPYSNRERGEAYQPNSYPSLKSKGQLMGSMQGESVSFRVWPLIGPFQWLAPPRCVYGQDKSDLVGERSRGRRKRGREREIENMKLRAGQSGGR